MKGLKLRKFYWLSAMFILAVVCGGCESEDNEARTAARGSLYVVARQSADAPLQYKAEMPLFTIDNIKSYNTVTGELQLRNFEFDTHLFSDAGCQYRVYFYEGDDLLFDAVAVSWFSSLGHFRDFTFQCDFFGPTDTWDCSRSHFYLCYGYPGPIVGDDPIEEQKKKNESGMARFINILRRAGKIAD